MKITMTTSVARAGNVEGYAAGRTYVLDRAEAVKLVQSGLAFTDEPLTAEETGGLGDGSTSTPVENVNMFRTGEPNPAPLVNLPTSLHAHATNVADGQRLPSNFDPPVMKTDKAATDPAANPASTETAPPAAPPAAPVTGNPNAAARAAAARQRAAGKAATGNVGPAAEKAAAGAIAPNPAAGTNVESKTPALPNPPGEPADAATSAAEQATGVVVMNDKPAGDNADAPAS